MRIFFIFTLLDSHSRACGVGGGVRLIYIISHTVAMTGMSHVRQILCSNTVHALRAGAIKEAVYKVCEQATPTGS